MFGSGREVRTLGLGFANPRGKWGKWDFCMFLVAVGLGGVGVQFGP